jgi:hypothetical protein
VRLRLIGLAVVAPALAGCLSAGEPQALTFCDPSVVDRCVPVAEERPAAASAQPEPRPRAASRVAGATFRLATFTGKHFSVAYPAGWHVATADAWNGTYLDTTIRSSRSPATYVRVDVMPGLGESDPARHARRVEAYLREQPGYASLAFRPTVLGGRAFHWEFTVRESGVLLRKVDVFLTDAAGNGVAILTQAPASEWRRHAPLFERLRASLALRARASNLVSDRPARG